MVPILVENSSVFVFNLLVCTYDCSIRVTAVLEYIESYATDGPMQIECVVIQHLLHSSNKLPAYCSYSSLSQPSRCNSISPFF